MPQLCYINTFTYLPFPRVGFPLTHVYPTIFSSLVNSLPPCGFQHLSMGREQILLSSFYLRFFSPSPCVIYGLLYIIHGNHISSPQVHQWEPHMSMSMSTCVGSKYTYHVPTPTVKVIHNCSIC